MNVYLLADGDGITLFDAGISGMVDGLRAAAAPHGGIKRILLGHAHADHRGAAPGLGVPVLCHADERRYAESERGEDYFKLNTLRFPGNLVYPKLLRIWDGGPVKISDTVEDGDEIAGFRVVHLPGHAPGLIALWRAEDGLALVSDAFYTIDPQTGFKKPPRLPHGAFNWDEEQLRNSLLKLAALRPRTVWTGHAEPLTNDAAPVLERLARS
jgi:glyoxylase-like metal-dependent hydrolase (beta-lactamase superfamily II)